MSMSQNRITIIAVLAATMALQSGPIIAATMSREGNAANPRGWSAVAGMDPQAVREMARTLPAAPDAAPGRPWCDADGQIEAALTHDFDERRITTNARDTALWGSEMMGTWTVVLERADATSCIIASGVGFSPSEDPQNYFIKVGLGS